MRKVCKRYEYLVLTEATQQGDTEKGNECQQNE